MVEDLKHPILGEQISIAMDQLPTMQAASLIIALILCYTVRDSVSQTKIFCFLSLMVVIVLCRIFLYLLYSKVPRGSLSAKKWEKAFLSLALISGLFWGLSAFLIFPAGNPVLMSMFILVIGALAAGTTLSHASVRFASIAWTGPAGICYAVRCAMEGGEVGNKLALMTIVYTLAILIHSLKHNKFITSSIMLKSENQELLGEMTKINDALRQEIAVRKQTEKSLSDREQRMRTILQTANEGFWLIDKDTVTMDLNTRMSAILGRKQEEILGRKIFDFVDEPNKAIFEQQITARAMGRVGSYEIALSRQDKTNVLCHFNATTLLDGEGNRVGSFAMVTDISERKKAELALKESEQKLRSLSTKLLSAQEEERKRIAGELHDSLGSSLAAIKVGIENARIRCDACEAVAELLNAPIALTQLAIDEVRKMMAELRPLVLDEFGVIATLNWFFRQYRTTYPGIHVESEIAVEEQDIPEGLRIVIFRITQEAFNNIAKYSGTEYVDFSLLKQDGALMLTIEDYGEGFDLEAVLSNIDAGQGLGLMSMRERAELSEGSFTIRSIPGTGTTLRVSWSLKRPDNPKPI
jgi:PAS domain S-box-containing protein